MRVLKKNGSIEAFDPVKIEKAILNAFDSCGYWMNSGEVKFIHKYSKTLEKEYPPLWTVSSSAIAEKVERFLMARKKWFRVGKAFILYKLKNTIWSEQEE